MVDVSGDLSPEELLLLPEEVVAAPAGPLAAPPPQEPEQQEHHMPLLSQEEIFDQLEDEFLDARDKVSPCSNTSESEFDCRDKEKHIFVLSESGKPIYTLHGDEDLLAPMFGVMQALVSYVVDSGDAIRSIRSADTIISFLNKSPLILVGVSRNRLSSHQLTHHLTYIYNQILFVLSLTQLTRIFEQRSNYDLRRMLSGSERLITHLSTSMDTDPSFFLSSVRCLSLSASVRDLISESIIRYCGKKDVVFGLLVADNQLITLVRKKNCFIHPADLHLVLNVINATESFKNSESWTPLCLPKFDSSGFLHAYVSYLSEACPACLVLITVDRNAFFQLSEARTRIKERLERHNVLNAISDALESAEYTTDSIELPELRHFLYKSRTSAQFTMPAYAVCYRDRGERERLNSVYLSLQNRFHSAVRPLKLCHLATSQEAVLGWLTQSFELYAVLAPHTTKLTVITAVNKLLRWVKKEEDRLFILTAPTF